MLTLESDFEYPLIYDWSNHVLQRVQNINMNDFFFYLRIRLIGFGNDYC